MRKLNTSDIFALARCLKRLGLKDQVKGLAKTSNSIHDVWDKGFDFVWDIFDAATENAGEREVYKLFAGPLEMTADEVEAMGPVAFSEAVRTIAKENDLQFFFDAASKLMQ